MTTATHSMFPGKRSFAPLFFQPPSSKRFKYDHQNGFSVNDHAEQEWMHTNPLKSFSDSIYGAKRSADAIFSTAAKRFKRNPHDEDIPADRDGDLQMVPEATFEPEEETELEEEVRSLLVQNDDILENVLGFVDSVSLQNFRGVSKKWKTCCEEALVDRQLAEPVIPIKWMDFSRLVFDAKFRVTGRQPWDFLPRNWSDTTKLQQNLQIEFSGLSWNSPLRSMNLTDACSNHLVNLISRNLNCTDGMDHDLKILVERGRVFLKLDQHWLPGTIPVRELAKLLGICKWKELLHGGQQEEQNHCLPGPQEDDHCLPESMDF